MRLVKQSRRASLATGLEVRRCKRRGVPENALEKVGGRTQLGSYLSQVRPRKRKIGQRKVIVGIVQNYKAYEQSGINNRLSNRFLAGVGSGLDLVLAYDTVVRFEYTFTRENTHGFFFHLKKEF